MHAGAVCTAGIGVLTCLSGCTAGLGFMHHIVKRNLLSCLEKANAASWEWMSEPAQPMATQGAQEDGTSCPPQLLAQMPDQERQFTQRNRPETPLGIIFEWPQEAVFHASEFVRSFILLEWYRYHWLGWLLWACERRLFLGFLQDALGDGTVELAIPIPVPAGSSSYVWLPEIRVLLILELRFVDRHYIRGIKVAVVDGQAEQIANALRPQLCPEDLREWDPRLAEFTEPIKVDVEVALQWPQDDLLRLELRNFQTTLHLPQ